MKQTTTTKILMLALFLATNFQNIAQNSGWILEDTLLPSRRFCTGSELDGKIYIIGGQFFFLPPDISTKFVVYDPVVSSWDTTLANLPVPLKGATSSVVDGKIYVIGGYAGSSRAEPVNSVYEYDPGTNVWTSKAEMPTPRTFLRTSVVDNKIYAIGGDYEGYPTPSEQTVEMYDPTTNSWTTKASMITGRAHFATEVVNEKIYAFGGQLHGSGFSFSSVEMYDPVSDTWTELEEMPAARSWHGSGVINDHIYVFGGGVSETGNPSWKFDPATDAWSDIEADLPLFTGAFASSVAVDASGEKCLYSIAGAGVDLIPRGEVYKYCPLITSINIPTEVATQRILLQNHPNPFHSSTTIQYRLKKRAKVNIKIFNLAGQQVATLIDEYQIPGEQEIVWNAEGLPPGVYLYRLQTEISIETGKCVLQ